MAAEHHPRHVADDAPSDDEVRAILTAVAATAHPRQTALEDFARAALRRAPAHLLVLSPETVAERLREIFDAIDGRREGEARIQIRHRSPTPTREEVAIVEVVSEDRPFLLSTVRAQVQTAGCEIHGAFHPIVGVERGPDGRIRSVGPARHAEHRDSVVQFEVEVTDLDEDRLVTSLHRRIEEVRDVTDAFAPMHTRLRKLATALREAKDNEAEDVASLLTWLLDDNVVLLGLEDTDGATFGLLEPRYRSRLDLPDGTGGGGWLEHRRSRALSTVQRRSPVELFDIASPYGGRVLVAVLFTRKGITEPAMSISLLRHRLNRVFETEDVVAGSHDAVVLTSLFEAVPKDELLRCDDTALRNLLTTLYQAEEYRDVRLLLRPHGDDEDVSVLVAIPRDRWNATLRTRIESLLTARFDAHWLDTELSVTDRREVLARFLVRPGPGTTDVSVDELSAAVIGLAAPWEDTARRHLNAVDGIEDTTRRRAARLVDELPVSYRDTNEPDEAVDDVLLLERAASGEEGLVLALGTDTSQAAAPLRLAAAKRGAPLELSAFLPILESLGLLVVDEYPHRLATDDGPNLTLHDFGVRSEHVDPEHDTERVTGAILAAWHGHLEVDTLNQLVVVAGLPWHDVAVLRTYRRLRRQLGSRFTAAYVQGIFSQHPEIVRGLLGYFHARFDPAVSDDALADETRGQLLADLNRLERLDHDRVLRGLLYLVDATLRTNAFRSDAVGEDGEPYIALKIDPSRIPGVARPLPYREIFVHSPRVEGVHLRAGAVARGGLRWSDRRDDVRTEVLDLMKAQVLKNSVIVPTGAKGGFVVTHEPDDPEQLRAEVRRQYVTFVRGLLDVTDDLDGDTITPPPEVVRRDGDDPYLVVAADRGTATFSDTANELAEEYGFWLGDAFASGGSQGYDHKGLGVTARGAWVAVRRHFRELGLDVDAEPVTIAGVGDMSGDVFGNGLLRTRTARLVAAFDHRHIFLDPDPDPEASFDERKRLFELPRSSWADYDRGVLSEGGMIVDRSARSVTLNDAVRAVLRTDADELTPPELIQAVLRAPVDLLFAGGIGTYVKASEERHEDVGDRTNDELRIDATQVRARVLGEGANLFITQRGRVELARRGCHLNQDAVDNAAGVATSDLEVNLKILLRIAEQRGDLDRDDRNTVLADLTDDVVDEVLNTVDRQAAAISRESSRSPGLLDAYEALLRRLEEQSDLDRDVEVLPDEDELTRRGEAGGGLTRPELGTLVAWAKRDLKEVLLDSEVPDSPLCHSALEASFLPRVRERFGDLITQHRLRRELIATRLANDVVDRMGVTFAAQLAGELDRELADVVHAFQAVRLVIDADRWWGYLDVLDATQEPARVRELESPVEELLATLTRVVISDPTVSSLEDIADAHAQVAEVILDGVSELGTLEQRRARIAHTRWLVDDLVEPALARFLASTRDLTLTPDVAAVRRVTGPGRSDAEIVDALLRVGEALDIDRLTDALRRGEPEPGWGRRQRIGLSMDLRRARRAAVAELLSSDPTLTADEAVDAWLAPREGHVSETRAVVADAVVAGYGNTDALGVAARRVRETVEYAG